MLERENEMTGVEREEMRFDLLCMALFLLSALGLNQGERGVLIT